MKHVFTLTLRIDSTVTNEALANILAGVAINQLNLNKVSCLNEDMTFKHTNVEDRDEEGFALGTFARSVAPE
jgi:hypothetical protein